MVAASAAPTRPSIKEAAAGHPTFWNVLWRMERNCSSRHSPELLPTWMTMNMRRLGPHGRLWVTNFATEMCPQVRTNAATFLSRVWHAQMAGNCVEKIPSCPLNDPWWCPVAPERNQNYALTALALDSGNRTFSVVLKNQVPGALWPACLN